MLRLLFVSLLLPVGHLASNESTAKFTGYMYGGRPLGLAYVKYTNINGNEAMEGQEAAGDMTQDQMM